MVYSDCGGWDHLTLVKFPVQISEATLTQSLVHCRSTNLPELDSMSWLHFVLESTPNLPSH